MRQDSSLLRSPYRSDSTMMLLYHLAHHHVGTTILDYDCVIDDFLRFCKEMKTRLERLSHLQENGYDDNGTRSDLKDAIMLVGSYQEKYKHKLLNVDDTHPEPSTAAGAHIGLSTVPEPFTVAGDYSEPSTFNENRVESSAVAGNKVTNDYGS
ncbi:hypothetical protein BDC45DRAFT_511338 [Circinella umbellata]|nr:hypothetical protein BDC45DRAFT_511338 [Circinella umbellata]